jgi:hypothetical protein
VAPPYAYSNFSDLKAALAERLSDPAMVYFVDTELGLLLNQALREFNSIAKIFRDRGTFVTVAAQPFYDLTTSLQNGDGELFLGYTVTSAQLLQAAKYLCIEPNPDNDTDFTDGFSLTDFNNSFTQRRNQFLLETGITISQPTAQVVVAGEGRVVVTDDSIIDIRRATWTDLDGNVTQLLRQDAFASLAFSPSWPQSSGTPQSYSIYPDPLLTLQLIPPPVDNGTLTLQTISSGSLPDDFMPYILWGVLGDMLRSPGPLQDSLRAEYAEARFKEGVIVGKQFATVLTAYINGVPVSVESIFNFDTFQPSWQVSGAPAQVGLLGSNLATVAPVADGVYSVLLDCVRNAPQLVSDTDTVPIGREYLDTILDYAEHLAMFKQGGAEFQATLPQYDAFVKAAMACNNRMSIQNIYFETMVDKANQQESQVQLRTDAVST